MSVKGLLRQQARANRLETEHEETLSRTTTLFTPSKSDATALVSFPSGRGTGMVSHLEDWTSSSSSESPSIPLASAVLFPEPHRADGENKALRYLSELISKANPSESTHRGLRYLSGSSSEAGPSRSAYGSTIMESMYDVPPAYRPNK